MPDALSLLALQIEWGADEALLSEPVSRLNARPAASGADRLAVPATGAASAVRSVAPAMPAAPKPAVPEPARPARPAATAARGPVASARAIAAESADLDALRVAIATFSECGLRDTATRSVLPTGNTSGCSVAIVGEVPDEDEDRAGVPFAGRAGDLLDRMLGSIGLDRARLLLLPLIPWRPPGGRAPNPIEMSTCLPFAERALELARPDFILCMGGRPARAVADSVIRAGGGWRKPVLPGLLDTARALPMRHPSYLLSHLTARKDAWSDLIRLRRALDAGNSGASITGA